MVGDFREVQCAAKLAFLEDILWEWVGIQERSIRLYENDCAWWYGERASMGAFAGAVWRAGGYVLEKYSTEKLRPKTRLRTGKRGYGRGDMSFALGGRMYNVEAKQCWPELRSKTKMREVYDHMGAALRDASRTTDDHGYTRLAVVFAAPRCMAHHSADDHIEGWIAAATDQNNCAVACVFPHLQKKLVHVKYGRQYPGAAIFVRYAGGRRPPT
jgi:hypothetical protein